MRTRAAVRIAKRTVFRAINIQIAVSRNFNRIGGEPPIHQIEMMRRFVHPKTAAARFQTMPAPKIIRAVARVEIPFKIDGSHVADFACLNDFLYFLMFRRVAIIESTIILLLCFFSASRTDWHWLASVTIGFSVITVMPLATALMINS